MRPVSGEELVTVALQSSLARAQKNFNLSNRKKLSSSSAGVGGSFGGRGNKSGEGATRGGGGRPNVLKLNSEFDLWIEQASEFIFTSEVYTNGAAIPVDIECLNSTSKGSSKGKPKSASVLSKESGGEDGGVLEERKNGDNSSSVLERKLNGDRVVLKGKCKSNTGILTQNSIEILKQIRENRKEKKKFLKLRKILLKEGHSAEDTEKLLEKAKRGGFGAINSLRQALLASASSNKGKENLSLAGSRKKNKTMKDFMENGDNTGTSSTANHNSHQSNSTASSSSSSTNGVIGGSGGGRESQVNQLPQPKRILYPREKIIPGYMEKMPIGAGFFNMGNSCYLNASLQAVFHVPAFINWLRQDAEHRKQCQDNMNCIICAMKKTLDSAMSRSNPPPTAIRPVEIINRLRSICRHFSHGRQEDAHEFLRYLFESMERSYLSAIHCQRIDNRSKETNPLGQIFGGYLRTEVTCLKCHYVSTTFQPTAELQLDIRHVTTLEDALMNHFKKERLDNNDYKCEKCRTISQATKQFSLEIPPIVLCLQLKRFTLYGTKIAKRIHCNRYLNMFKYMHKSKQANGCSDLRYRLVALVTHLGSSPNCGHYTAIAEAQNGNFYQFDDSYVHQVTVANALNNDAYVIIYEMDRRTRKSPEPTSSTSSNYATNVTGLGSPSSTVTSSSISSFNSIFPKKMPSLPIPKVPAFQSKLVHNNSESESKSVGMSNGTGSPSESVNGGGSSIRGLNIDRKVISFGIRQGAGGGLTGPKKITILKPGASLTNSSKLGLSSSIHKNGTSGPSPSGTSRESKSDHIKLVPYNDDENEESDKDESRVVSNGKRLKTPELKQNSELPITPPKSPKPSSAAQSSPASSSSSATKETPTKSSEGGSVQKDTMKRKAPAADEETPRKSRPHRRRRSSSTTSTSSTSSRNSSDGRNDSSKRKREEHSRPPEKRSFSSTSSSYHNSDNRRERENHRDSQERDRERRRDRNPSRSPSASADKERDKRASSIDKRRADNPAGNSFDASRLKHENPIVGWDGQKSLLSKSMDEDRKRSNEKSFDEEYDDEFDQGRTKKVRRSLSLPRESECGVGNRFQNVEDKKKQIEAWKNILDGGYGNSSDRRSGAGNNSEPRSWSNGDDLSRHNRRSYPPRPNSGGNIGTRPRHSGSNYSRNHGRSPYRNGHHNGNGGGSYYRSQSHGFHHNNTNGGKHWNGSNDRNRH